MYAAPAGYNAIIILRTVCYFLAVTCPSWLRMGVRRFTAATRGWPARHDDSGCRGGGGGIGGGTAGAVRSWTAGRTGSTRCDGVATLVGSRRAWRCTAEARAQVGSAPVGDGLGGDSEAIKFCLDTAVWRCDSIRGGAAAPRCNDEERRTVGVSADKRWSGVTFGGAGRSNERDEMGWAGRVGRAGRAGRASGVNRRNGGPRWRRERWTAVSR